jgi:hypothetical protein
MMEAGVFIFGKGISQHGEGDEVWTMGFLLRCPTRGGGMRDAPLTTANGLVRGRYRGQDGEAKACTTDQAQRPNSQNPPILCLQSETNHRGNMAISITASLVGVKGETLPHGPIAWIIRQRRVVTLTQKGKAIATLAGGAFCLTSHRQPFRI